MAPNRRWWLVLAAILVVAAWARLANLGTFSLWADEVFTMTTADRPLLDMLGACAADADNPPLYLLVTKLALAVGADETSSRLAPIAAGLASILLLAIWVRGRFGPGVALLTASFCALSTFHIRYSQELRSYPYLLLVCAVTLLAADRVRRSPDRWSVLALGAAVAVGCYTHLVYPLGLVPAAGSLVAPSSVEIGDRRPTARTWACFAGGIGLGVAAFIPWILVISSNLVERMPRPWVTDWSWAVVGNRWQVWTVATREIDPLSWLGLGLAGAAAVGVWVVLRRRVGVAIIIPTLATVVLWELLLLAVDHWSNSRYNMPQWPFIAILLGLGFERILVLLQRRWLRFVAGAVMVGTLLAPVSVYHRIGRPHWDRLADVVGEVRRPAEKVLAGDHRAGRCLSYYLGEGVPTVADRSDPLGAALEVEPSLLLISRVVPPREALEPAVRLVVLADVPGTALVLRLER